MGYRSTVAYYISFKDKEQREAFMNTLVQLNDEPIKHVLKYEVLTRVDNCALAAYHEDVKWYEGYVDVQAEQRIMELALEWFPDDAAFKFVRIGEDEEDAETVVRGENTDAVYDRCYIVRRVELDWSMEAQDAHDD